MTAKKIYVHRQTSPKLRPYQRFTGYGEKTMFMLNGAGRGYLWKLNLKKFWKKGLASFLGKLHFEFIDLYRFSATGNFLVSSYLKRWL